MLSETNKIRKKMIGVCDFFSGCGGSSTGFRQAGMSILMGLDCDNDSEVSFRANHLDSEFIRSDISEVSPVDIENIVAKHTGPLLFCGCAPCQPFTKQNTVKKSVDPRRNLLIEFGRFVEHFSPEYIFVENVPGLQKLSSKDNPLASFIALLERIGYSYRYEIVPAWNYGVPQRRKRLVLLASLKGEIDFPVPTHGSGAINPKYSTVKEWITGLPKLKAGETDPNDSVHRAANLSKLNLERIMATPPEGSRSDWPKSLSLECHSQGYSGHTDVYGRMKWNFPASGLTTRCISLSNGRFGHPEQNRAISVREAACIQTFPRNFRLFGSLNSMARQVGNAVPVLLAQRFGEHILADWQKSRDRT